MESTKAPRKACDLCYRRKMKCDGQKPRCLHCITYEVDCTYTAPSRIAAAKKRRSHAKSDDSASDTQSRLRRLESLIQRVTDRLDDVEKRNDVEPAHQNEETSSIATVTPLKDTRSEDGNSSPKSMALPPLDKVLPIIQIFLQDFNSVLPLFHADTLLRLVHDWYNTVPTNRDPLSWAAINVILALSRRHNLISVPTLHDIPSSSTCISRVESVLSRVVLGSTHLLNIQILVGMVMLLQAAPDLKPALVLIGTTMRLAHSIGLHDRACSAHLERSEKTQRACVFWLAYVLDKDLSMRSKQPSVQIDDDIDLELPSLSSSHLNLSSTTEDKVDSSGGSGNPASGTISTTIDTTLQNHYFTSRIQLATLQGGVYDYIYSTRSRTRSPAERSVALHSVARALEQWKASIPAEFTITSNSTTVSTSASASADYSPSALRFLGTLHATSLACETLIYQAHAWDEEWMKRLCRYGTKGGSADVLLLPPRWEVLVGQARELLMLFGTLGEREGECWNFWITGCSYMTAMVLLTANSMHQPKHRDLSLDTYLVEVGLRKVGSMAEEMESEMLWSFKATCTELHQRTQKRCAEAAMLTEDGGREPLF